MTRRIFSMLLLVSVFMGMCVPKFAIDVKAAIGYNVENTKEVHTDKKFRYFNSLSSVTSNYSVENVPVDQTTPGVALLKDSIGETIVTAGDAQFVVTSNTAGKVGTSTANYAAYVQSEHAIVVRDDSNAYGSGVSLSMGDVTYYSVDEISVDAKVTGAPNIRFLGNTAGSVYFQLGVDSGQSQKSVSFRKRNANGQWDTFERVVFENSLTNEWITINVKIDGNIIHANIKNADGNDLLDAEHTEPNMSSILANTTEPLRLLATDRNKVLYKNIGFSYNMSDIKVVDAYTVATPEPHEALYADAMEGAVKEEGSEDIYKFSDAEVIRVVEYNGYTGNSFSLSEDGIIWDDFTENENENYSTEGMWTFIGKTDEGVSRWVNTSNTKNYQYIKLPGSAVDETSMIKALYNVFSGDTITVRKPDSKYPDGIHKNLYVTSGRGYAKSFTPEISEEYADYITINSGNGYITISGLKETIDENNNIIDIPAKITSKNSYDIKIKVTGVRTDMLEDPDKEPAYIAEQKTFLTTLDGFIDNNDMDSVKAFFTDIPEMNVYNIDTITQGAFDSVDERFVDRIMSYGPGFFDDFEGLDGLESICNLLLNEVLVGEFDNLAEKTLQKIDDKGDLVFDDDGNPVYYTSLDEQIADMLRWRRYDSLELPIDSVYYNAKFNEKNKHEDSEFATKIRTELSTQTFDNLNDLKKTINDTVILTVFENSDSASYLTDMFLTYSEELELSDENKEKLNDIKGNTDVLSDFGQAIIDAKTAAGTSVDISTITDCIDNYEIPSTGGGGNGGGNGGGAPSGGASRPGISTGSSSSSPVFVGGTTPSVNRQPDGTVAEKTVIYNDVPLEHWAYEAVRFMDAKDVVSGYGDGTFGPENTVTVAEFSKMLIGLFVSDMEIPEDYVNPFDDLLDDAWYYDTIVIANVKGIFKGSDGLARPNAPISRQEAATLIYRTTELLGKSLNRENDIVRFNDESSIADWAFTPVMKMQAAGIINGMDGSFVPNGNSTRAMAAQMLYKTYKAFETPATETEVAE